MSQRRSLSSLASLISQIPGYSAVLSWFLQAGPVLSRHLSVPAAGQLKLRFRLTSPSNGLSLSARGQLYNAVYYLGNIKDYNVSPQEMTVINFSKDPWKQDGKSGARSLFAPARYGSFILSSEGADHTNSFSAPVALGWPSEDIITPSTSSPHSARPVNTTWIVTAPFDPIVSLGTCPCVRAQNTDELSQLAQTWFQSIHYSRSLRRRQRWHRESVSSVDHLSKSTGRIRPSTDQP